MSWRTPRAAAAWDPVVKLLRARHSPEQIAAMLARMQPYNRVSQETIYTALYALPRGSLRRELIRCLRLHRERRRPRCVAIGRNYVNAVIMLSSCTAGCASV